MNDFSTHLKLPYLMPSQAQKHVTVNESIRALDLIVQLAVLDRDLTSPPAAPADGDRFIVASTATGGWAGEEGKIAAWVDGAWQFLSAKAGWTVWITDEAAYFVHDGAAWSEISGASGIGAFSEIGVGGVASDATNKLAVQSPAVLFNHDGNGIQAKLNKAAVADTASVLFQTGFSGRAEFGLTGDDDWHVKVSPDGTNWTEALVVDKDNGFVGIGAAPTEMLHLKSTGSAALKLEADTGNTNEFAVPTIKMAQDGGAVRCDIGIAGSGVASNAMYFDMQYVATTGIHFLINGVAVGKFSRSPQQFESEGPVKVKSYTVATVPSASAAGAGVIIFVSDETGGAVLAFGDGSNWRRVTDRAIVA